MLLVEPVVAKEGAPRRPLLVVPHPHLMPQGFCPKLAEEATKAFHEDGLFRPCLPTIGKPSIFKGQELDRYFSF